MPNEQKRSGPAPAWIWAFIALAGLIWIGAVARFISNIFGL